MQVVRFSAIDCAEEKVTNVCAKLETLKLSSLNDNVVLLISADIDQT